MIIYQGQDSSKSESSDDREAEVANDGPAVTVTDAGPGAGGDKESSVEKEEKRKIITSEEEAKARIAEKRKEMKVSTFCSDLYKKVFLPKTRIFMRCNNFNSLVLNFLKTLKSFLISVHHWFRSYWY